MSAKQWEKTRGLERVLVKVACSVRKRGFETVWTSAPKLVQLMEQEMVS